MSLHADALGVLTSWRAPDAVEEALRERYVAHLASTPEGMRRASYPDHITAGTLVIDATGERVLLNLHRKAGRWFHFGGHCEDDDATLAAVALREAHEESGLRELAFHPEPVQLDLHTVPFCGERGDVNHLDVRYVAAAPVDATAVVSDESLAVRWWPVDDLPELEPAMHALIARARAILV
ncbi:NUDIX hydrolase [Nocardioides kongjuensis]|uniref:8-oxo-dGTP pyrophosphatase MutT (NUDIX family) n=1 Tax=Nocardioides kongjuensis TaxID=349522 RepID=A0A852RP95_9ACTN|nr:8-oxo-dGTP pyrophosphatase MutT (NUDIX family) [Nocardioides kongjuensis]